MKNRLAAYREMADYINSKVPDLQDLFMNAKYKMDGRLYKKDSELFYKMLEDRPERVRITYTVYQNIKGEPETVFISFDTNYMDSKHTCDYIKRTVYLCFTDYTNGDKFKKCSFIPLHVNTVAEQNGIKKAIKDLKDQVQKRERLIREYEAKLN